MTRTILRNIARNRMKEMGIGNVNQKMHYRFGDRNTMPDRESIAKLKHGARGREILAKAYKEHPAYWLEVLCGSKKEEADKAHGLASWKRFATKHPEKALAMRKAALRRKAAESQA